METQKVVLDPLCYQQFNKKGQKQILYDKDEFMKRINQIYKVEDLKDGYTPFCKHMIIENFTDTPNYIVKITKENEGLIRTAYKARLERELPVLVRYIPIESANLKKANYLDIILYNKEYVTTSCQARNVKDEYAHIDYDYTIKAILPKDVENEESPIPPITWMRCELGFTHGGSAVKVDREDYMKCVNFWAEHIYCE